MRDLSGARFNAGAAGGTFFVFHQDSTSLLAYRQRVHRASLNAWIIFALHTKMWHLSAWNKHKYANARRLRPDSFFMVKRAGDFAFSATAAFQEVPGYPDSFPRRHRVGFTLELRKSMHVTSFLLACRFNNKRIHQKRNRPCPATTQSLQHPEA